MISEDKLRIIKTWTSAFSLRVMENGKMKITIRGGSCYMHDMIMPTWTYTNAVEESHRIVKEQIWGMVNDQ